MNLARDEFCKWMLEREDMILGKGLDPATKKIFGHTKPPTQAEIHYAALEYAKRNKSDPFAYNRAYSKMANGIFHPYEVRNPNPEISL